MLFTFDPNPHGIIDPDMSATKIEDFPETVVSVFSYRLFNSLVTHLGGEPIARVHDTDGDWPVYRVCYQGHSLGFFKARLGAPACVAVFEEVIAMGARRIILTGTCGVLDKSIPDCGIILPTRAIRDEGTSYHYAPAGDYIDVNTKYREEFASILRECGYTYVQGTTWTTDAVYRETATKAAARRQMGAICVEMECAAMAAMCAFRGVEFFQYLYAADNLDSPVWDPRSLSGQARLTDKEKIGLLAFELACRIDGQGSGPYGG